MMNVTELYVGQKNQYAQSVLICDEKAQKSNLVYSTFFDNGKHKFGKILKSVAYHFIVSYYFKRRISNFFPPNFLVNSNINQGRFFKLH